MRGKARVVRLTPLAEADLEDIWAYIFEQWSLAQAEQYVGEIVAAFNRLARGEWVGPCGRTLPALSGRLPCGVLSRDHRRLGCRLCAASAYGRGFAPVAVLMVSGGGLALPRVTPSPVGDVTPRRTVVIMTGPVGSGHLGQIAALTSGFHQEFCQ
ncbi:type II toxin-antitoxin system RelE/ParE family toxin [Burkholderia glumae]|uniref:type II toxin-antitoxin system RelE/ParE family toxin n=1 Tax=Burkholderia glumae TaxID=337 RepID=UPI003B9852EC